MSGPTAPRVTTHRLAPEEAAALAWMLEITAHHCWMTGECETATALEGGAVALRLAGVHDDEFDVVISDEAVDDLTAIAWDLLDQIADHHELIAESAETEWAQIGADLAARDQTGGAFTQFVMECPRPEDLPAYAAGLVSRLRTAAHIQMKVA